MCENLALDVGPTIVAAQASQAEALARIASYGQRITEATKQVQLSAAAIQQSVQATKSAVAVNDLENELLTETQKTSFGLYRRYHSYDLWRAKALLESARRYGVAARRATEARFALNLSDMNADEPFVAAPATWADEVYAYDLGLPGAVGLSVGEAEPGGIYSNKVYDYVANLERFINGYSVNRPSSTAQQDTEIVSLPGPFSKRKLWEEASESWKWLPAEEATAWKVFCPDSGQWVTPVELEPQVVDVPPSVCNEEGIGMDVEFNWKEFPCGDSGEAPPTGCRSNLNVS